MKNGTKGDERLFIIKKLWNKIKKLPRKAVGDSWRNTLDIISKSRKNLEKRSSKDTS